MSEQPKNFAAAIKTFFGLLPGQSLGAFSDELKNLTHEEKVEFVQMLNTAGHPTEMPAAPKVPAA